MFDNDMNIVNRSDLFNSYPKVYIISSGEMDYLNDFNPKIIQYKHSLVQNLNKLIPNSVILKSSEIEKLLIDHKFVDVIYPGVGHNQDFINKFAHKIKINYIYRDEDLVYWKYANSGFYKFKNSFYKINKFKIQ